MPILEWMLAFMKNVYHLVVPKIQYRFYHLFYSTPIPFTYVINHIRRMLVIAAMLQTMVRAGDDGWHR